MAKRKIRRGRNSWITFMKKHRGQGYSVAKLKKMYDKEKKAADKLVEKLLGNPTYPTEMTKYFAAALGGYLAWRFID